MPVTGGFTPEQTTGFAGGYDLTIKKLAKELYEGDLLRKGPPRAPPETFQRERNINKNFEGES